MTNLYKEFQQDFSAAKEHFTPYMGGGWSMPDDEEFFLDANTAIGALLELGQKVSDEGNITPAMAQNIVQSLEFLGDLARGIGDGESVKNLSFLANELSDFAKGAEQYVEKPYLRGLDF